VKPKIAIVGCGIVGPALGKLLSQSGYGIIGVASRTLASAERAAHFIGINNYTDDPLYISKNADIIFITTPDSVIKEVCEKIAYSRGFSSDSIVIHCSGALPSEILSSAHTCRAYIASLHPLQSFASVEDALKIIPGSYFSFEGDKKAVPILKQIIKDLEGIELEIPTEGKALYHAAASVASNFLITLMDLALNICSLIGVSKSNAFKALLPLIQGSLKNIESVGIPAALTGPIARGDVEIVKSHIASLESEDSRLCHLYKILALHTIDIALAKGTLKQDKAHELRSILSTSDPRYKIQDTG